MISEDHLRPAPSAGALETRTPPPFEEEVFTTPLVTPAGQRGMLWRAVDGLLLVGVAGMLITVGLQVITRMMSDSLPWTEELTRYLFIWTTFLGLAAGTRTAEHARITLIVGLLPRFVQKVLVHVNALAGATLFAIIAYKGWHLTAQQFRSGEISPALGIGMYIVTLPVVLSAVLAFVAHIQAIYFDQATRERIEQGETQ